MNEPKPKPKSKQCKDLTKLSEACKKWGVSGDLGRRRNGPNQTSPKKLKRLNLGLREEGEW